MIYVDVKCLECSVHVVPVNDGICIGIDERT